MISQGISLGIGAFAAYSAWRDARGEECEECAEEARKVRKSTSAGVQKIRIANGGGR